MNLGLGSTLLPGDPRLIDHIVGEVKSQGIFDQFRKDCIADVDTKPAYQNLRTRVESSVNTFLSKQRWRPDLNKNQLRETLRKHISDGPYLDTGVERIVDQVVNPKIYSVFMPQVEDVVYEFMGLEKPKRARNGPCGLKDLLPKDLDPVSPESDKNSLKDVSLDSVDDDLTVPGEEKNLNVKGELEEFDIKVKLKTEEFVPVENEISNGKIEEGAERSRGEPMDLEGNTPPHPGLNDSGQSEEKEEEEEDSPVFEPIDIMNLNESNISNDSHLSGISELTSHRSRSPDFLNDFSRDNFDFSNQDSQLSKVSSDSRLSIVTDFGSSNQPTTPVPDVLKDENSKDTFSRDNFMAIRDEGEQIIDKTVDVKIDGIDKQKENLLEMKDGSDTTGSKTNLSSQESSRDDTESIKEKSEHKSKERTRESGKSRSSKERSDSRESRGHREKDKDKRVSNKNESKVDNSDKSKYKEKSENSRDSSEKIKESKETPTKLKEEKVKESPSKEGKDLKDIYKEKIRELREKKELTEKEKLGKDNKESKDVKSSKESKEKRDSSRDKEKRRSSSSKTHSSSRHESRSSKSSKSEKEKNKRDESYRSKEGKSKSQSESNDKSNDKSESKKVSKPEKEEKSDVKNDSKTQKSTRNHQKSESKSSEKSEKRDDSRDKKRKDEKKTKPKDDHSSLRKGSRNRRSSDRDGSSGSSGRGSQRSNSSPSTSTSKPSSSSLGKDSSTNSNSSSETSDGIDETQTDEFKPSEPEIKEEKIVIKLEKSELKVEESELKIEKSEIKGEDGEVREPEETTNLKRIDPGQIEISLPLKKRPLQSEDAPTEHPIKKPKFARNFAEAKKLMKVRKRIEKEKLKSQSSIDRVSPVSELSEISETESEIVPRVPDEERVQIIKVKADDDDEPYPETDYNLTLDESSKIILTEDEILNTEIVAKLKTKSTLSEMESSIRESLNEMITDKTHGDNTGKIVENSSDLEIPSTSRGELSGPTDNIVEQIESERVVEVKEEKKSNEEEVEAKPDESINKSSIKCLEKIEEKEQKPLDISQNLETLGTSVTNPQLSDDEEDCRYFITDNERLNRFTQFLNSLEHSEDDSAPPEVHPEPEPLESQTMAPPQTKRKYSTSPLSDILLSNSNNNNEGPKLESIIYEEGGQSVTKKKKMGRPKKQRLSLSSPSPQMNGENFALPMSPESDVSASSDNKNMIKEERNRPRGSNQRYTSDDLYKPRPLFASSSRRSRRSNP